MKGFVEAMYSLDGRTGNNAKKPKKILKLLMKTVTELYVRDKANNDLTLSLDLFSSTGAQMVSSISSLFGPLVKGMMPVKHIVNRLGHIFKHIHYM